MRGRERGTRGVQREPVRHEMVAVVGVQRQLRPRQQEKVLIRLYRIDRLIRLPACHDVRL